jgi:hypothetical protein
MASKLHTLRAATFVVLLLVAATPCSAFAADRTATIYAARITSANAWHDLITQPANSEFLDAYVAVVAASVEVGDDEVDRVAWDVEGQLGYSFGDQSHWELNFAWGPRWRAFPWNDVISTAAAFRIGLSMASEVPELEVQLEGDSEQLLIYWVVEFTLTPPTSAWGASVRLHHRSPAFGLFGDDGGMNAVGLGVRRAF